MKKLLTLLALLCCMHSISNAHKFSIGLRGGINYCVPPVGISKDVTGISDVSGKIGSAAGLRFLLDLKKIQFGLSVELQQLGYDYARSYTWGPPTYYHARQSLNEVLLFANYKTQLPRSYIYYGLSAGIARVRINLVDNTYETHVGSLYSKGDLWDNSFASSNVLTLGLQAGYSFRINKHFSVSGEAALRYLPGNISLAVNGINYERLILKLDKGIFHFPVTAGISYTF